MALICDTGGVYALYDADDAQHEATCRIVEAEPGPLWLPVILLAEIDYLLQSRLGTDAAFDFVEAVAHDEFALVPLLPADLQRCRELLAQYRDLAIGLADATIVAAAERLQVPRLLSQDQRHFRAIQPRGFDHFTLLPADAERA
jgi:predicted nucleic acid-binding protein